MPPEERDYAYLWDMLHAAEDALSHVAAMPMEQAIDDDMRMAAFERKLEIVGEAERRVSSEFMAAHPDFPWRGVIGLRNVLAHKYGEIDRRRLYDTATRDLPRLIETLKTLTPPLED